MTPEIFFRYTAKSPQWWRLGERGAAGVFCFFVETASVGSLFQSEFFTSILLILPFRDRGFCAFYLFSLVCGSIRICRVGAVGCGLGFCVSVVFTLFVYYKNEGVSKQLSF